MRRVIVLSILAFGVAAAQEVAPSIADGNNAFAFEIHRILKPSDENQFFSPLSITAALGMTEAGARNGTAAQMRKALHLGDDPARHERLGGLIHALNGKTSKADGYELAIVNRLWPQKGFAFQKEFLAAAKDHYRADPIELDYAADAEGARQTINGSVEKDTREKIKNLIPSGALSGETRMVLTNAIYFKGDWETSFEKTLTKEIPFFVTAKESVPVPMMARKGMTAYAETPEALAVELPFKGGGVSMVLVLPRDREGMAALEADLQAVHGKLIRALKPQEVALFIPRFKMECSVTLNGPLAKLGMIDAFVAPDPPAPGTADFAGMTGRRDLFISAVLHKAFVEVNEEGAEAAAATAVIMRCTTSVGPSPKFFRADRPFLFLIRDVKSGTILFLGRFAKP